MSETKTKTEQHHAAIASSLTRAGIGRYYHPRKLSEVNGIPLLLEWARNMSTAKADVREGSGWTIVGAGASAVDAAILTARALHLSGCAARVVSLIQLSKWLQYNAEELESVHAAQALFVTEFFQKYGADACPLTGREIATIEDFLTTRLGDCRAVFPVAAQWGGGMWWSGSFVQRVAKHNRLVEVPL